MTDSFINLKEPINANDLSLAEKDLSLKIPEELRNHLLIYNGGFPVKNIFTKDGEDFAVNNFLAVKHGLVTLEKIALISWSQPTVFPSWLLAFASDAGGNHFCISLRKQDHGHIYFWDHEIAYDSSEDAIIFLTDSFNRFISLLREDD